MTRRDIFTQIMMEATGLPANSVSDYAGSMFHGIDRNASLDEPLPDLEAQELIAMLRLQLPGLRRSLTGIWNKAEADIAERQGRMN
jgi:hypothetical protein